ncbi:hypothetical protein WEN_02445 [Mycoplasma wenyonii str. Massachusetts]|uniref:Uncharacterized protein n=1 Tax=Mycoplasma wenyonii (strain Massachusetts) TaxID=1197325 RepID=I6YBC3_MYCWM|nr:hypothetical protein [Mycoplasma wenyonii]AFN65276.1 hypothetical protein WEN_02445 [Mycoplasma wenyonii str. Massachusetts]
MSLPLDLLGKAIVALVASAGVAIPVSHALKSTSVERVKLKDLEDLKKSCLIVLQGSAKEQVPPEPENKNRKLLACQRDKNPWTTEFYFYDSSSPFDLSKLKKVKSIDTNSGDITEVTLILEGDDFSTGEKKEIIKDNTRNNRNTWTSLRGIDLKEKTTVDMREKKMKFEDNLKETNCTLEELK